MRQEEGGGSGESGSKFTGPEAHVTSLTEANFNRSSDLDDF